MSSLEKPSFRNDSNTRYLRALFIETAPTPEAQAISMYTLADKSTDKHTSLYEKYMDEDDMTEFVFAEKYLESHEHWLMLTNCTWFKEQSYRR